MALPTVQTFADCADFSLIVSPFISQLISLPTRLIDSGTDIQALQHIYVTTNPFITAIAFAIFLAPVFLIASEVTRNYSQVDRSWSILPIVYNVHYSVWSRLNGLPTGIIDTICGITIIWGLRLTFNYWRRGGYSVGSEDYRWAIVRRKINNHFLFFLFNLTFISLAQPVLLALITAPTYVFVLLSSVSEGSKHELSDSLFSRIILFFVFIEALADQQQWRFQKAKKEYNEIARIPSRYKGIYTNDDLSRGFVVSGLWAWCRHPNFVAEQAVWLALYQWSCVKTDQLYNWTGIGSLCYVALFQGSTYLTEKITASKYPDYKQYQLRVGKFIPRLGVEARGEIPEDNALSASVSASEDPNQPQKPQLSKTKTTKKLR
ncbi:DUF1295 domain-containing protein [Histoplasma capsulatum var. duboisii H88]|uniref:DUF1295 domain-containing protein n=1 Tax=Ajellomyces capsulatus (strain H88) TaxID=544711 RepID=F0U7D3_AJEC8|nr:DUF1295 domain-containing protein [Histoplasma capsulatum var. duboisii H88]QSS51199.1 DUF1295 domain-containing protein [Histoplasma capsulatum var. duboisii H88]